MTFIRKLSFVSLLFAHSPLLHAMTTDDQSGLTTDGDKNSKTGEKTSSKQATLDKKNPTTAHDIRRLYYAAMDGNVQLLAELLKTGINPCDDVDFSELEKQVAGYGQYSEVKKALQNREPLFYFAR